MPEPEIVYEDKNFLAVNKPTGLQVHAAKIRAQKQPVGLQPTLVDWLIKKYPEIKTVGDNPETRPGIVHRLDKETSGVLLVARNQEYFEYLKSLFQNREIAKTYRALVIGKLMPRNGVIDKPIGIKNGTLKRSVHSEKMQKEAITEYNVKKYFETDDKGFSLVEVYPKTGRTHQIRVHLASVGHPVAGDSLYGPKKPTPGIHRLMLHAVSLEFKDKDGKRLRIEADPPEDFEKAISALD